MLAIDWLICPIYLCDGSTVNYAYNYRILDSIHNPLSLCFYDREVFSTYVVCYLNHLQGALLHHVELPGKFFVTDILSMLSRYHLVFCSPTTELVLFL